jgi:hypothetical protein
VIGLAALIVIGSVVLWIGVPVGGFWLAGHVTSDAVGAVLIALLAVPATMVAFGWVLYRIGALYEAMRGAEAAPRGPPAWRMSLGEERAVMRRTRGGRPLIDVAMTCSAVAALVVMAVWFFFFSELVLAPMP